MVTGGGKGLIKWWLEIMEIYIYKSQTGNKIMREDFVTEYFMLRCTLRKKTCYVTGELGSPNLQISP